MQQQTQHTLEKVVLENSNDASGLSVQMIDLRVVQQAVANLMNRIDEITEYADIYKWNSYCDF